jgi:hypothetical protein
MEIPADSERNFVFKAQIRVWRRSENLVLYPIYLTHCIYVLSASSKDGDSTSNNNNNNNKFCYISGSNK